MDIDWHFVIGFMLGAQFMAAIVLVLMWRRGMLSPTDQNWL